MKHKVKLLSPAKINLYLKVTGKRSDGYHDLVTLFERIDLCDEIRMISNREGRIRIICDDPDVPTGRKNLIYKVARMLQEDFALQNGVDIFIKKRIPVAAGLGGGSSNAATALLGLNEIWHLKLTRQEQLAYAARIGSDVPFFLYDCSWAIGTGRGDKIRKISLPVKLWHVLIVPRVKMYTPQVYGALNLHLTKGKADVNILTRALRKNDLIVASRLLVNDLEKPILQLSPKLSNVKNKVKESASLGAAFSGSGPSLFSLAGSRQQAEKLRKLLSKRYRRVFAVRTL